VAPLLSVAVVALFTAGWVRARGRALASWRDVAGQMAALRQAVDAHHLEAVDGEETALAVALGRLRREVWFTGWGAPRLRRALGELGFRTRAVHRAADSFQQGAAAGGLRDADLVFDRVRGMLPGDFSAAAAAAAASRGVFACPMHPEVRSPAPGTCSVCGMPLAPQGRGAAEGQLTLVLQNREPLRAGQRAFASFNLRRRDGTAVTSRELIEVHTKRLHLLIVDSTLTDYHHEHPVDTDRPGLFTFDFVPRGPGPYRVWADVLPAFTGAQEYVVADLPSAAPPVGLQDRATVLTARVDGLDYELGAPPALKRGVPTSLQLTIRADDGRVVSSLEPLMGAFAHLVAFDEDWRTVLHVHPSGGVVSDPALRGRGELTFVLAPRAAGTMVLFAQVQIGGASRFARFVLPAVD
jgi:hypothetical protein